MQSKLILSVVAVAALFVGFTQSSASAVESKEKKMSRAYIHNYNVPASGVALEGYCPVAYFAADKAILGKKEFSADYNGVTYYFVSEDARKLFNKSPKKYLPAYGGWCAFGMAVNDKFPVDPTCFKIVDGKLHLFLRNKGVDALKLWNGKKEKELKEKAVKHWTKVKG